MDKIEKRSTHPVDIKNWIEKVMDSCETVQQLIKADRLRDNFYKLLERNIVKRKYYIFGGVKNEEQWSKKYDNMLDLIRDLDTHFLIKLNQLDKFNK